MAKYFGVTQFQNSITPKFSVALRRFFAEHSFKIALRKNSPSRYADVLCNAGLKLIGGGIYVYPEYSTLADTGLCPFVLGGDGGVSCVSPLSHNNLK